MRCTGVFCASALVVASCAIRGADIVASLGNAGAAGSGAAGSGGAAGTAAAGAGGTQYSDAGASDRAGTGATAGSNSGASGGQTGSGGSANAGRGGSASGEAGAVGAFAGTGGSAGAANAAGSGGAPPSVCDGAGTRVLSSAEAYLDNFEISPLASSWSSYNDTTPANSFALMRTAGGALGTGYAGHYAGTNAKTTAQGGFGVGTELNVALDPSLKIYCADITAFDGVSFWARGAAGSSITLQFVVPATVLKKYNGDCEADCYNHPFKTLTLTADWAQYAVRFSDATGKTGAKVKGRLQELLWGTDASNWDFSLDEITFYKGTPPSAPVPSP